LSASNSQDAVKFNGFGFRRVEEADAWVEANSPDHKFGLIVDVHMVFKQLYSSTAKTIPTLQQLAKIDMKDLLQGVAVSSFDHQVPKLLYDVTGYVVIKTDKSFFNQVKTCKEWDEPQTGFRDRLKVDCGTFKLGHKWLVTDNTTPSSPLQADASLSRTYALAWIAAFINFIDDTYDELTWVKFSAAQGWSLITRLATRILIEVLEPRNGVKQTFITGRNDVIAKQIFCAVIRSHDIMARYKDTGFKNDLTVASEYVKFLIMNTGMDVIDQLVTKHAVVEETTKNLLKDVKVAESKASSASNGVSSVKSDLLALVKRVTALEKK
jgi:hypothetical protein